jgi:SAM-dependent methyltransferase
VLRMSLHEAIEGFRRAADVYERSRPSFPDAAVDTIARVLRLGPGRHVVDLGAGTGKLTRLLVPSGARITAIEPLPEMRARLRELVPEAEALDGTAEKLPLPDAGADGIVVAQAWHWFDHARALAEARRVIRTGGALMLMWNDWDDSDPLVAELQEMRERNAPPETPGHRPGDWMGQFESEPGFEPMQQATFPHEQRLDPEGVVGRMLSVSYVAALPAEGRRRVARDVRDAVARHAGDSAEIQIPYTTRLYWRVRSAPT